MNRFYCSYVLINEDTFLHFLLLRIDGDVGGFYDVLLRSFVILQRPVNFLTI